MEEVEVLQEEEAHLEEGALRAIDMVVVAVTMDQVVENMVGEIMEVAILITGMMLEV